MTTNTPLSLTETVTSLLVELGWTRNDGTAIASKTFETAVGPKVAFAYLSGLRSEGPSAVLGGDYQSEGRNVLSAHGRIFDKVADESAIRQVVALFASDVDHAVGQSYAARLHRLE